MMTDGDPDGPTIARNPDGHLHAFVFVDHSDEKIGGILEGVAGEFRRKAFPRVRWAGSVVGDYLALVHIEVDDPNDLNGLQTFIENDLWDKGVHCQQGTEVATINKKGTKKLTPEILALVGIKTKHGHTRKVAERLAEIDWHREGGLFKGASILTGRVDILLQLNTGSFLEAQDQLFLDEEIAEILGDIEGIVSTSTAFADGTRGSWTEPFPDDWETPRPPS
jgi:DNA-binding Lrp family transcriptional regulator